MGWFIKDSPGENMPKIEVDKNEVTVAGDYASTTLFKISTSAGISRLRLRFEDVDTVLYNKLKPPFNLYDDSMEGDWDVVGTAGHELAVVLQKNDTGKERTLWISLDRVAYLPAIVTIHQQAQWEPV